MPLRRFFKAFASLVVALAMLGSGSASAQSISLIRDTEIESIIRGYATPVFVAAGLDPTNVRIYIVNDRQINAFVAGGQNLFINSGLLMQSTDANQVIGVIAHEAGHIAGGHLSRVHDALARGTAETILSMVLGAAAALAGRPDVGFAVMSGGQNIALRNFLLYSRTQESAADSAAMKYLEATGQSARGLSTFLGKLADQEMLSPIRQDPYLRTHPLGSDRIQALSDFVARARYSNAPIKPELQRQHQRMLAKLRAFLEDPSLTLQRYPASDTSEEARYARAIAQHRATDFNTALATMDGLIADYPADPYYLELKGQMLFETGKPKEAVATYEKAAKLLPDASMIRLDLARAQLATNDPALLPAATENLRASVAREPNRPFVWRQLAIAYGRAGDEAESALALAEEAMLLNKPVDARYHAGKAERLLPTGSPGWMKAQDIIAAVDVARERE